MSGLSLNLRAESIADTLADDPEAFGCAVTTLANGARVIDAGVEAPGGWEAGLALGEICMGGLGSVTYVPLTIGEHAYMGVAVSTDHPHVSCMASQYAGWAITPEGYFGMGSGPLRAHARVEKELFALLGYAEEAEHGVLVLETRQLPDARVAEWVAARARLDPAQLTFVVAPTASTAGAVQISARILETGLHKLEQLHFDIRKVVNAIGTAPVGPVAKNDLRGIGRTNDCILYGGQARYLVKGVDDDALRQAAEQLPASASRDYGRPFYEIFEAAGKDFYKIDPLLFSPAEVWLTSADTGKTFHGGRLDAAILAASCYPA
ncbi:MAG: methenyltetrahydromethanopterin cyclohydrolase [Gemmatimonadales bacterium]|nr:methenyltetrahydromethanopterin cyclohydrolase [Gemmatimonadales bacterium]